MQSAAKKGQGQRFAFAGRKALRFGKRGQGAHLMIQFSGWLLHKQQQHFFAGTGTGIGDSYTHLRIFHLYIVVGKGRIAQTKAKRKTRTDIFLSNQR